jgi:predicted DsbA family dithiol-disulfide isomerase
MRQQLTIDYFSDVLCVWAYGGQVRLDELCREFGDRILVRHRFMPLFADTEARIGEGWAEQGGFEGFGEHMREVCGQWPHVCLHDDVWTRCRPASCTTAHVFLRAAGLCMDLERDEAERGAFDALVTRTRNAFFERAVDIGCVDSLMPLLEGCDLAPERIRERIDDGTAYAALQRDIELAKSVGVIGSPTYVFNEGRQLLYGNVGYRIIETNVRELLAGKHVDGEPSWC